jgi:hypothetical protein
MGFENCSCVYVSRVSSFSREMFTHCISVYVIGSRTCSRITDVFQKTKEMKSVSVVLESLCCKDGLLKYFKHDSVGIKFPVKTKSAREVHFNAWG